MSDDIHEVYAVRYAEHARKRSENYIFGDPHDEMTSISYYVWVIKGPHGVFVCDTGFDEAAAKERARKITHPVGEGLQALGVDPDKVEHVIATHMHWDHAGNYDLFPQARYHVQDTEMAYCTGRCMCHPMLRIPFSESDVHAMVQEGVRLSRRIPRRRRRDRARHHRAQNRRPLQGPAMRAGEDAARLCRRRLRLLPSVFAHRRGPRVPDHLFGRRHARGLQDACRSSPPRSATSCRATTPR